MSNEAATNGSTGPPLAAQNQLTSQHQSVRQHVQGLHATTYPAAQAHHRQQILSAMPQAQMDAACSQLLMNPHTAAMVATVAAAAAQQMAQQQHHSQTQPMLPPAQSSGQQHQVPYHPAPPSSTPPPQMSLPLPPHLVALLGMPVQTSNTYTPHGTPAAQPPVVMSGNTQPPNSNVMLSQMQNWKLKQLEAHVQLLRDTNQPISQPVAMLLADARRKEEKRTAKRVANRKSACTSRARKKALVEEMTRTNARLKRQAMILALLPDLVIAITTDGEITFCSAQVERVLRHNISDLVGANLADLLTPPSRKALTDLVNELVTAERVASEKNPAPAQPAAEQVPIESCSGSSHGAAIVSVQSLPPLSVVQVESQQSRTENLSLANSNIETKPATSASISSMAPQSEGSSEDNRVPEANRKVAKQSSSDDSLSSSSDNKNLLKANENLNRNVRMHNEKSKATKPDSCHKDDVTGEAVTANNAGARLSSLQHRPKKPQNSLESLEVNSSTSSSDMFEGEDEKKRAAEGKNSNGSSSDESGYRESREDTESSEGEELSSGHRPKPLAPACNICLIRDDLTTIWCEVTSSIRTRSLKDEYGDDFSPSEVSAPLQNQAKDNKLQQLGSSDDVDDVSKDEVKELLLCLRPIRDGDGKIDESLRFRPAMNMEDAAVEGGTRDVCGEEHGTNRRPVKKRPLLHHASSITTTTRDSTSDSNDFDPTKKKARMETEDDPEQSVVESLMLMGKN